MVRGYHRFDAGYIDTKDVDHFGVGQALLRRFAGALLNWLRRRFG